MRIHLPAPRVAVWGASLGLVLLSGSFAAPAQAVQALIDVPPNSAPIVDLTGALDPDLRHQLDESLVAFQKEHGPQIQALIVPTLGGEAIESFSIRVADRWKTGARGVDNGVILVVALNDRQARIEVGKGLEGSLPDALAGRIIRETLVPYFKASRYSEGVTATLQAIAADVGGSLPNVASAEPPAQTSADAYRGVTGGAGLHYLFIFFLIAFLILPRIFGRRNSSGFVSGMILGNLLGGGGRSSGGGFFGGGGGGGFGGGGGGGFNGGGASGQW